MKVFLDKDEWYPVFTAAEAKQSWGDAGVEVSEDFMARYGRVMLAFDDLQDELAELWSAA